MRSNVQRSEHILRSAVRECNGLPVLLHMYGIYVRLVDKPLLHRGEKSGTIWSCVYCFTHRRSSPSQSVQIR